ncbi:MAG: hypothetical protein CO029_03515 [Candidatus Magasanikbacteria bacterium CG_4_9_14_0_2_um_filter_41_10]|uniref:PRC-barrel domain-containing protein n=1 Tax=Candidatus Magasanikbacteria bacterium CG_4_10_14_0_2_um_filter_41_31 TaxID=1974639 RepID=A0A2M7V5I0_9BACT|nr:MAG: hypothetical protein COX83_00790 [Candidatus Magasanikbacteria bacterium CG_4_10_14_0_2_um_filter_41_31]PJC53301.1 MAG: hypothetical protein CO029_03515 [Candidatus Magasanikbacteria bacterium CG_4_9_14_0_2_um_filter_41_10]
MRITYKQLKKLPVVTQSGQELGSVHDAVIDIEAHVIALYEVSSSVLSTKKYSITPTQVVSITEEKMIVKDAVVPDKEQESRLNPLWQDTRAIS